VNDQTDRGPFSRKLAPERSSFDAIAASRLWIEPADGGRSERVAERLKFEAGKATLAK
jgi:hypothetical protein